MAIRKAGRTHVTTIARSPGKRDLAAGVGVDHERRVLRMLATREVRVRRALDRGHVVDEADRAVNCTEECMSVSRADRKNHTTIRTRRVVGDVALVRLTVDRDALQVPMGRNMRDEGKQESDDERGRAQAHTVSALHSRRWDDHSSFNRQRRENRNCELSNESGCPSRAKVRARARARARASE